MVDWMADRRPAWCKCTGKTYHELIESLRIGAQDMLKTDCDIPENSSFETIEI